MTKAWVSARRVGSRTNCVRGCSWEGGVRTCVGMITRDLLRSEWSVSTSRTAFLRDEHEGLAGLGRHVEQEAGREDDVVQVGRRGNDRRFHAGSLEERVWVLARGGAREWCAVTGYEFVRDPNAAVTAKTRANDELVDLPVLPCEAHLEATVGPESLHASGARPVLG